MAKVNYKANYTVNTPKDKGLLEVSVDLYQFIEDGLHYMYSPQLDLYGYGNTEKESKESFHVTIEEFFRYSINKNTLDKQLRALGWKVSKTKWTSPDLEDILRDNENFSEILHKKEYKKTTQNIPVPELV